MTHTLCLCLALAADPTLDTASQYVARGMQRFRDNDIAGSLRDFDRAAEMQPPRAPHLWQRGISHYYAGRYDDGRRQFEIHKAVNPHDVENATWHFVCVARQKGLDAARTALIDIDTRRDTRVPMAEVYEFYAGRGSADEVLKAAETEDTERARMYAHLYLGLYYEVAGSPEKAEKHMRRSAAAKLENEYMHDVARIHLRQRGWQD
jgi:lipoprotein NlpI